MKRKITISPSTRQRSKVTAASKMSRFLVNLIDFQVGFEDEDEESVVFYFEFDKRKYYREECCSTSGCRYYELDDLDTLVDYIQSNDYSGLAEDILTLGYGTGDIAGLCISGDGPSLDGEIPEIPLESAQTPAGVKIAKLILPNLDKIKTAIEKYCADIDNYQVFDEY